MENPDYYRKHREQRLKKIRASGTHDSIKCFNISEIEVLETDEGEHEAESPIVFLIWLKTEPSDSTGTIKLAQRKSYLGENK